MISFTTPAFILFLFGGFVAGTIAGVWIVLHKINEKAR